MREKKASKTFKYTSALCVSARTFIDDKDTDAFRAFHMRRVGTRELEILNDDVDVETRARTTVIRTVPGIKLPRLVARVVPNGRVEFVDTRTYEDGAETRTPFAQTFTTVNNITKHSEVRGTITVRETGVETCAVDVEGGVSSVASRDRGDYREHRGGRDSKGVRDAAGRRARVARV